MVLGKIKENWVDIELSLLEQIDFWDENRC